MTLEHLMSHRSLGMHFVKGYPSKDPAPNVKDLLEVRFLNESCSKFSDSGGGFLDWGISSFFYLVAEDTVDHEGFSFDVFSWIFQGHKAGIQPDQIKRTSNSGNACDQVRKLNKRPYLEIKTACLGP